MKYGLIGERLSHSFSAQVHEYIGGYKYELLELKENELERFFKERDFCGVNITIPYKEKVMPMLDIIDEKALKIGSVNTVINENGVLHGYNTDFDGLSALLLKSGFKLWGKKVLILGTGGTAKTAMAVCKSMDCGEIHFVSRNGELNYENVLQLHSDAQFIINTTPCGMYPNISERPLSLEIFKSLEGVCDTVYNPLKTKLLLQCEKSGIPCCGGLYMLVSQAIKSSELFFGNKIDSEERERIFQKLSLQKGNIVLTGMPGCGKTTIGKLLSKKLSRWLVDIDEIIAGSDGRTIREIIIQDGIESFRNTESKAIFDFSKSNSLVIATGGGAVLRKENIDTLKLNGTVFFLDRPLEEILPTESRPLSSTYDELKSLYNERYELYRKSADVIINIDGPAQSTVEKVITSYKKGV